MSIYKPSLLDKFKDFVNGIKGNWDQYEDHVADFESHLAEYVKLLGSNGYQKLPGGLIIQWGVVNIGAQPEASSNGVIFKNMTVNFPIVFPNAAFSVATSTYRAASSGHQNLTKSSVVLSLSKLSNVWEPAEVYYVAVGY